MSFLASTIEGFSGLHRHPVRWFVRRFVSYAGAAIVTAGIVVAGAGLYRAALTIGEPIAEAPAAKPVFTAPPRDFPSVISPPSESGAYVAWNDAITASGIIGVPLYASSGKLVGTVKDLTIDSAGQAGFVVGGFLGIKEAFVPLTSVEWYSDRRQARSPDLGVVSLSSGTSEIHN